MNLRQDIADASHADTGSGRCARRRGGSLVRDFGREATDPAINGRLRVASLGDIGGDGVSKGASEVGRTRFAERT